jgi:exopolysaccharide biosynthesis protein
LLRIALILVSVSTLLLSAPADSAAPYRLSVERHRTVLTLYGGVLESHSTPKVATWHLSGMDSRKGDWKATLKPADSVIRHVVLTSSGGKIQIDAAWRHAVAVQVIPQAHRLEIVFSHHPAPPTYQKIAEGVGYWEGQRWTGGGPARVRTLRIDPKRAEVLPAMAAPGRQGKMGLEPVRLIAERNRAVAGINGTFFSPATLEPLGLLVINGQLVSSQLYNRSAFYFLRDGRAMVSNANLVAQVTTPEGEVLTPHAVNQPAAQHQLTLYSDHYGFRSRTWPDPSRWEVALSPLGTILNMGTGDLSIPMGGFVLSAQGKERERLMQALSPGSQTRVTVGLEKSGKNVAHVIGGGPTLVSKGKVRITAVEERFRKDVALGRAPRTALGVDARGELLLATVDGRKPGYSVGMTLKELAQTLDELGVQEAINLDGGGSTTMAIKGAVVNHPSDGKERWVSNALIVKPRPSPLAN